MCKYPSLDKAVNYFRQDFKGVSTWHDIKPFVQENFPGTKNIFTKLGCTFFFPFARPHSIAQYALLSTPTKCSDAVSGIF